MTNCIYRLEYNFPRKGLQTIEDLFLNLPYFHAYRVTNVILTRQFKVFSGLYSSNLEALSTTCLATILI
jgi:hypothetical protein